MRVAKPGAPHHQIARSPVTEGRLLQMPRLEFSPGAREHPGKENRDEKQYGDERQRKPGIAPAIEQKPGRGHEPRDERDGRPIDVRMKLVEHGSIMSDGFPAHGHTPSCMKDQPMAQASVALILGHGPRNTKKT